MCHIESTIFVLILVSVNALIVVSGLTIRGALARRIYKGQDTKQGALKQESKLFLEY